MTIIIHDLQQNSELDNKAMAGVRGGYSTLVASQGLKLMPKMPGYGLLYPSNITHQSLNNYSEQLNIAVGSAYVSQGNSNTVMQF
ncbi:hypothetical protein [Marinobacterium rhizophilum]|uniref:hypothetical protein n=1 Tax=Marinobacterium rhizophilum TaxID=420402 RepID=UPI000365D90F|nr:hypothetical protein [Marinobacterium rhizophilum]